jgi:hypothetical protein
MTEKNKNEKVYKICGNDKFFIRRSMLSGFRGITLLTEKDKKN